MLTRFRRLVRSLDQRVWLGVGALALIIVIWFSMTHPRHDSLDPLLVQATIDAASTQANAGLAGIAAQLTLTPSESFLTGAVPTLSLSGRQEVRQWAASASADSEFDRPGWAAVQAAGPPNTPECGDFRTAWATALPNGTGVITLLYAQLVKPTSVHIYQSFNPGFIVLVELIDLYGERHTIYEATPQPVGQCPFVLSIPVEVDYKTSAVIIRVDQSTSLGGWNQIDAVELIGIKH